MSDNNNKYGTVVFSNENYDAILLKDTLRYESNSTGEHINYVCCNRKHDAWEFEAVSLPVVLAAATQLNAILVNGDWKDVPEEDEPMFPSLSVVPDDKQKH